MAVMIDLPLNNNRDLDYEVIVTDGLWGVGKSALLPIINSLNDVQMVRFDYQFEHLSVLGGTNLMRSEIFENLVTHHSDNLYYSNLIGRHVNLRLRDDSGFLKNPRKIQTLVRLLGAEGDGELEKGHLNKEALHLMTHNVIHVFDALLRVYGIRLKFVELFRNPVFLLEHWFSYLSRFDGLREATLSYQFRDVKVPWFAADWSEEFAISTIHEQCLLGIARSYEKAFDSLDSANLERTCILPISFEDLCFSTSDVTESISNYFDRSYSNKLAGNLRRSKLPRAQIANGKGKAMYGYRNRKDISDESYLTRVLDDFRNHSTSYVYEEFLKTLHKYNSRFPSKR